MKHFLGALVIVLVISIPVNGEEITFSFRGTVHEMDGELNYFTGQTFELTYSFECATYDADPDDPESGRYLGAIKSGTLTLYKDSVPVEWIIEPDGSHNFIEVKNLDSKDAYSASVSISGPVTGDDIPAYFIVELTDNDATAFQNDALPSSLEIQSFSDQRIVRLTFIVGPQTYTTIGVITDGGALTAD